MLDIDNYKKYDFPLYGWILMPEIKLSQEELDTVGEKQGCSNIDFLKKLVWKGLNEKIPKEKHAIYIERIKTEIETVSVLNFIDYFLLIWRVMNFADKNGIAHGRGRGSMSSSAVLFLLKCSGVDPIQYKLLFARFLSVARAKNKVIDGVTYIDGNLLADADLDFESGKYHLIIDYLKNLYPNRISKIAGFATLSAKILCKNALKICLDMTEESVKYWADKIPKDAGFVWSILDTCEGKKKKDSDEWEKEPVLEFQKLCKDNPDFYSVCLGLQDIISHTTVHPAGWLISHDELDTYLPTKIVIDSQTGKEELCCCLDMSQTVHFATKLDLLKVRTCAVISRILKETGEDEFAINLDSDPIIYDNLQDLKTPMGLFQIESNFNYQVLKAVKPKRLTELMDVLSLARPGAYAFLKEYVENSPKYTHPLIEEVLKDTRGVCLEENTEIWEPSRNKFIPIKDFKKGYKVNCLDENLEPCISNVNKIFDNGMKECYKINTNCGYNIISTCNHKFLTEIGWKELKDLKEGDYIATAPKLIRKKSKDTCDDYKLRILGNLLADGYFNNINQFIFCNKDEEVLNEYEKNAILFKNTEPRRFFNTRCFYVSCKKPKDSLLNYHQSCDLYNWMRELGMSKLKSDNKFIPEFIFKLSNKKIALFLAAMWDCDGGGAASYYYYTTISDKLANGVHRLLNILGLHSTIYEYNNIFKIHCSEGKKFVDKIGKYMICKRKLHNISSCYKNSISMEPILEFYKTNKQTVSKRQLEDKGIFDRNNWKFKRIKVSNMLPIAKHFNLKNSINNCKLNWDKIKKIEFVGKCKVYDLEIEKNHNYIAKNFVVHNCLYQESLLKLLMQIGFTADEAEVARKVVGKKLREKVQEWKEKIFNKAKENGHEEKLAKLIWDTLEASASYSFAASHACSYAALTALTTYLKFKYPLQFFTALLQESKNEPNPIEEIAKINRELQFFNIKLLPPDLTKRNLDFQIEDKNIRFGLQSIKGISEKTIGAIQNFHPEGGNKLQMFEAAQQAGLNIGVFSAMIYSGCLDSMIKNGSSRGATVLQLQLWKLLKVKEKARAMLIADKFNHNIFDICREMENTKDEKGKPYLSQSRLETIRKTYNDKKSIYDNNKLYPDIVNAVYEWTLLGFIPTGRIHNYFKNQNHELMSIHEVNNAYDGDRVQFVGMVCAKSISKISKNKNRYLKLELMDDTGTLSTMFFNQKDFQTGELQDKIGALERMNDGKLPAIQQFYYVTGTKKNDTIFANQLILQDIHIYFKYCDELRKYQQKQLDEVL